MGKAYYLYLGYYMNLKVFYCTKDGNVYAMDTLKKGDTVPLYLFAGISVVFYATGKGMRLDVAISVLPIIIISIILGSILGLAYSLYTDRQNQKYFSLKEPIKIKGKDYWKTLLKDAVQITWSYRVFRFVLILLALVEPFIYLGNKDMILLVGYFVIWFALVISMMQFRIHKRKRIIRILKKEFK